MHTETAPAARTAATPGPSLTSGTLLVIGSCASLQFGAALASQLFGALGTWGTTALRLGVAAVILLAVFRPAVRSWDRRQWQAVLLFGASLAGMNGFFYAAIARLPLGIAVSIEFLGPLALTAILSRRLRDAAWIGLALGGMALFFLDDLTGQSHLDPLGIGFVLIAATLWACYILTSERVGRLVPGQGGLAMALTIGALAVLPLGWQAYPTAIASPSLLVVAVGTAVLASVVPYSLEFAALRRLPTPVFGILLSLEPAIATLAGWLLLGQTASVLALTAMSLVVAASVGSTLASRRGAATEVAHS